NSDSLLQNFGERIASSISGTRYNVERLEKCFHRCWILLGACSRMIDYLPWRFSFDATTIGLHVKQQLLVMTGLDAAHHIVPLCFAIVPTEDSNQWGYFFKNLRSALPSLDDQSPTRHVIRRLKLDYDD